jgi:hypothetical protein
LKEEICKRLYTKKLPTGKLAIVDIFIKAKPRGKRIRNQYFRQQKTFLGVKTPSASYQQQPKACICQVYKRIF